MKILCEDKSFGCDGVILSMRSSVFKRMLCSEMLEKKRKEVTIENFSARVVSMMLTFIYTGSCDVNEYPEIAEDLFRFDHSVKLDISVTENNKKITI